MGFPDNAAQLQRELFTIAASEKSFKGAHKLIQRIAQVSESDGAVLWRLTEPDVTSPTCRLLASDQYFGLDPTPFWHSLTMESPTGKALRASRTEPCYIPWEKIEKARGEIPNDPDFDVIERLDIHSFLIVPVLTRAGGAWGSLNLYWRNPGPPPTPEYRSAIRDAAGLVPDLDEVIDKRTGFDLIHEISELVGEGETRPLSAEHRRDVLSRVVKKVEDTFNVAEVSIYLEALEGSYRTLRLEASRWPWPENQAKRQYSPGEGMTGYCYSKSTPVSIPDLKELRDDLPAWVGKSYPGMKPTFRFDFVEALKLRLPLNPKGEAPPVSWLAVPLHDGTRTFGVMRICGSKSGPWYFQERHQGLLGIIAHQVGQWYGADVRLSRAERDGQSLKVLADGLSQLNAKILDRVSQPTAGLDESRRLLFAESMKIVHLSVPRSETNSIRLVDSRRQELYFEYTDGPQWTQGSRSDIERRKAMRFPLNGGSPLAAGATVVNRNRPVLVSNTATGEFRSFVFPGTRSILIVPVSAGRSALGTLDLRSGDERAFEDLDIQIASLVGRQLGLYLRLIEQIFALKTAREGQEFQKNSLRMTMENLEHQLKTPIYLATRKSDRLEARARRQCPAMSDDLAALTGLCRRAEQIVTNVRLFTALARNEKLKLDLEVLRSAPLIEMLNEFRRDYILLSDPERHLQIEVVESSFSILDTMSVRADLNLLAQMLGNLLENAVKYSYANTTIRVRGATTRNDSCFGIAVANKGVPITIERSRTMPERGEKADRATLLPQDKSLYEKSEGTGLGLYLAREIISAHEGFLEIEPTNPQTGITEFRVAFPRSRSLS